LRVSAVSLKTPILHFYYTSVLARTAILNRLRTETGSAAERHDVEPEAIEPSWDGAAEPGVGFGAGLS
jgi:hypothetical protein